MHCSLMNMGSGEHSMSHNTIITCVFFQFLSLKMFPFHSLRHSKLLKCICAELTRQSSITSTILVHEIKTKWLLINRVRLAYCKRSRESEQGLQFTSFFFLLCQVSQEVRWY